MPWFIVFSGKLSASSPVLRAPPSKFRSAQVDAAPSFADDGFLAGPSTEVLRCLLRLTRVMPGLGLRFSTLVAAPAAGESASVDWQPFVDQGCVAAQDGSVEILKSPIGPQAWCERFAQAAKQSASGLSQSQVRLVSCLMRRWGAICFAILLLGLPDELFAAHYPAASCGDAAVSFDAAVHSALSCLTGNHIDASQWEQAGFALRDGGLGMRLGCCPSGLSEGDSCPLSGSPCGPPLRRTHSWQLDC